MLDVTRKNRYQWSRELRSTYDLLEVTEPNIAKLSMDEVNLLAQELERQEGAENNRRYIFAAVGATTTMIFCSFLMIGCWELTGYYLSKLVNLATHPTLYVAPLVILAFAALCYAVIIPVQFYIMGRLGMIGPWLARAVPMPPVDLNSESYWLFSFVLLYSAFPALYGLAMYRFPHLQGALREVATCWFAVACLLTSLLVCTAALSPIFARIRAKRWTTHYMVLLLMRILLQLRQIGTLTELGSQDKEKLLESIKNAARGMLRIYPDSGDAASRWAIEQLSLSSINFLSLASWIYLPQHGTIESLRSELCVYLNIFVTGRLHDLPRKMALDTPGLLLQPGALSGRRRAAVFVILLIYLGFPPMALLATTVVPRLSIPSTAGPPLALLYVVWIVCGLATFAERISPDTRALFTDILKTIVGRK